MVLAVAVVHRVLRDHQPGREHQVVDGRRVGMAADHVAAHREAVELPLPLLGIQLDLVLGPALDTAAHLLDAHGVGFRDGVVVEAGDGSSGGGRSGCRSLRARLPPVSDGRGERGRARPGRPPQDPLEDGVARDRVGRIPCGGGGRRGWCRVGNRDRRMQRGQEVGRGRRDRSARDHRGGHVRQGCGRRRPLLGGWCSEGPGVGHRWLLAAAEWAMCCACGGSGPALWAVRGLSATPGRSGRSPSLRGRRAGAPRRSSRC